MWQEADGKVKYVNQNNIKVVTELKVTSVLNIYQSIYVPVSQNSLCLSFNACCLELPQTMTFIAFIFYY